MANEIMLPTSTQLDTLNEKLAALNTLLENSEYVTKSKVIAALGFTPAPVDTTLSQEGKAAESAATGAALAERATILDTLFLFPRTGKVYGVKIPRFAYNSTTVCEKIEDNAGLVCVPSTDTTIGQDDYADIPLFRWYDCNYKRDENGHAYPTAIKGFFGDFQTTGDVDVGVIQMVPFVKWDSTSDENYQYCYITDTPTEGYTSWYGSKSGGIQYPYIIHSKYYSGKASDGLLRSQPNLIVENFMSHDLLITEYQKKGTGYWGAGAEREYWDYLFILIKYAQKSSQQVFAGRQNSQWQYAASIESSTANTYFPVTTSQAENIVVGDWASVGYGSDAATPSLDRSLASIHAYAKSAQVVKKEALDDSNVAIYLDVSTPFTTTPYSYSSNTSPIYITSVWARTGSTDAVKAHHDGSIISNTNSKFPYRIQGCEYAIGLYVVSSNSCIFFTDNDGNKTLYAAPWGTAHSSNNTTILSTYKAVASITAGDWLIGDVGYDAEVSMFYPTAQGSSTTTGCGDYIYGGGKNANGNSREHLMRGDLGGGSDAGVLCLGFGGWLGNAGWRWAAAD